MDIRGNSWMLTGYIDLDYIQAMTRALNGKIIMVLLGGAVVMMVLAILALNVAYRPILSLRDLVLELSCGSGDLTRRLAVTSTDDLGQIWAGINRFIERLQEMMGEVQEASGQLKRKVALPYWAARPALAYHVRETEQVVTAINEMSRTAVSVSESAASTAQLTGQSQQLASKSRQVIDQAMDSVIALVDEVRRLPVPSRRLVLASRGAVLQWWPTRCASLAARTQQSTAQIQTMLASLQLGSREHYQGQ